MKRFTFPTFLLLSLLAVTLLVAQSAPSIGGYCPVAYAEMNQAVKGSPDHSSHHDGQHYLFVNADAKKMFDAMPAKYAPRYQGYCATAVAQGMKVESDPTVFTVVDGKTYLFSNADAKKMFDKAKSKTIKMADGQWAAVAKKPVSKM